MLLLVNSNKFKHYNITKLKKYVVDWLIQDVLWKVVDHLYGESVNLIKIVTNNHNK